MFDALRARFGGRSTDDKAKDREAKRLAKALAAQKGREHYRNASGKGHDPHPG